MKRARVLLLLLAYVSFTSAQSPQDNVAQRLVGAWRLVSAEGTDPTFHQDYRHATGLIIYDRSGWMSAQIDIKGTRKPFTNGPDGGTNEEKVANFHDYLSYYRTTAPIRWT